MDADYFLAITAATHSSALLPAAHILVSSVLRPLARSFSLSLSLSLSLVRMHDAADVVPGARRTVNWLSIPNKLRSLPARVLQVRHPSRSAFFYLAPRQQRWVPSPWNSPVRELRPSFTLKSFACACQDIADQFATRDSRRRDRNLPMESLSTIWIWNLLAPCHNSTYPRGCLVDY